MPLSPGTRLGAYEIVAPIGAGGMGEVYRARDARLGRDVAIKVLPSAFATDPDALARFEREMKTLAGLSHPHIVAIYDVGRDGPSAYAVTELLDGRDAGGHRLARTRADPQGDRVRRPDRARPSPRRTTAASSIATSSRPTWSSRATRTSRCWISAWRGAWPPPVMPRRSRTRRPGWSWARSATWRRNRRAGCRSTTARTSSRSAA